MFIWAPAAEAADEVEDASLPAEEEAAIVEVMVLLALDSDSDSLDDLEEEDDLDDDFEDDLVVELYAVARRDDEPEYESVMVDVKLEVPSVVPKTSDDGLTPHTVVVNVAS